MTGLRWRIFRCGCLQLEVRARSGVVASQDGFARYKMTYDETVEFWKKARRIVGDDAPKAVIQLCEVAALGAAFKLAQRLTDSTILQLMYLSLLVALAARIVGRIALPKAYDSPSLPIIMGLAFSIMLVYGEDRAINSAVDAAVIQMQSDKAVAILDEREKRLLRDRQLLDEFSRACDADFQSPSCQRFQSKLRREGKTDLNPFLTVD